MKTHIINLAFYLEFIISPIFHLSSPSLIIFLHFFLNGISMLFEKMTNYILLETLFKPYVIGCLPKKRNCSSIDLIGTFCYCLDKNVIENHYLKPHQFSCNGRMTENLCTNSLNLGRKEFSQGLFII